MIVLRDQQIAGLIRFALRDPSHWALLTALTQGAGRGQAEQGRSPGRPSGPPRLHQPALPLHSISETLGALPSGVARKRGQA
jgi:hypothetical protein